MSTSAKVVGFLAAAAAVFGLAIVAGRAFGPVGDGVTTTHGGSHAVDPVEEGHGDGHGEAGGPDRTQAQIPGGLMVSENGYTLALTEEVTAPGTDVPVSFTITGPDGATVTDYEVVHEKQLHLIAVRRDFDGFQHVHPVLGEDGVWSTDLQLTPGTWRVFADFKATGAEALTLGADLSVTGDHRPALPAAESRTATVGDYEVTLEGELTPGADARLTLDVTEHGKPVTDLQPYLGAYGHLVALRAGDLAYLHVHPDGTPGDGATEPGPEIVFHAAVPSTGTYHLYLDFKHDGVVRTAAFTVTAGEAGARTGGSSTSHDESGDHSGH